MLKDLLDNHNCFKLVCGAGNEDAEEVEKLVAIYSKAGCQFFDVCAKSEIVDAAKRGLKKSGILENRYICVSVGIDGDPHITKADINKELCLNCGLCKLNCPHEAINSDIELNKERCIGCGICSKLCPQCAIKMESKLLDYDKVLPQLIEKGIDCVEFHAISSDEEDVDEKWNKINDLYNGLLCISLDRSELGDKKLLERVKRLIEKRSEYSTIIQADGIAMSGNDDEYGTTLQAVATAQLFQNSQLPVYIMMSGGTNTKSIELANKCDVHPHCIAIGSYARKIVKDYLKNKELFNDENIFSEAVEIAHNLVKICLENMKND